MPELKQLPRKKRSYAKSNALWLFFVEWCKAEKIDHNDLPGVWFDYWDAFLAGAEIGCTLTTRSIFGVPGQDGEKRPEYFNDMSDEEIAKHEAKKKEETVKQAMADVTQKLAAMIDGLDKTKNIGHEDATKMAETKPDVIIPAKRKRDSTRI